MSLSVRCLSQSVEVKLFSLCLHGVYVSAASREMDGWTWTVRCRVTITNGNTRARARLTTCLCAVPVELGEYMSCLIVGDCYSGWKEGRKGEARR